MNMTIDQQQLYIKRFEALDKILLRDHTIAALAGARWDKDSVDRLFRQLEK